MTIYHHYTPIVVGFQGGEGDLSHVPAGGAQWHMFPVGDGGGERDVCHVCSEGRSVAYVPRGGSLPCTVGALSDTCP